jgi:peptidoglycan-associated lipoprotein
VEIIKGNGKTKLNVALEKEALKEVVKVEVGDDLGKILNIKIIYFALDKADILPRAVIDLEKILAVLNQNPLMKIDVRSHTDCRQSARYNQLLSDRRAKATVAWLISKGISPSRLSGRGYGESQLVNSCGCEPTNVSSCTEEQHQRNRRSEFIILEM